MIEKKRPSRFPQMTLTTAKPRSWRRARTTLVVITAGCYSTATPVPCDSVSPASICLGMYVALHHEAPTSDRIVRVSSFVASCWRCSEIRDSARQTNRPIVTEDIRKNAGCCFETLGYNWSNGSCWKRNSVKFIEVDVGIFYMRIYWKEYFGNFPARERHIFDNQ